MADRQKPLVRLRSVQLLLCSTWPSSTLLSAEDLRTAASNTKATLKMSCLHTHSQSDVRPCRWTSRRATPMGIAVQQSPKRRSSTEVGLTDAMSASAMGERCTFPFVTRKRVGLMPCAGRPGQISSQFGSTIMTKSSVVVPKNLTIKAPSQRFQICCTRALFSELPRDGVEKRTSM